LLGFSKVPIFLCHLYLRLQCHVLVALSSKDLLLEELTDSDPSSLSSDDDSCRASDLAVGDGIFVRKWG
jgi:hypothetical protein